MTRRILSDSDKSQSKRRSIICKSLLEQKGSIGIQEELGKRKCSQCAYSARILIETKRSIWEEWTCIKSRIDLNGRLDLAEGCASFIADEDYKRKCLERETKLDMMTN